MIIVYHNQCHDGITALWAAKQRYPRADVYPGNHGEKPNLETFKDQDVVFVDFCWKVADMLAIQEVSKSLTVLDHHVSAETDLAALTPRPGDRIVFDMDRSGAGLTWDVLVGGQRPPLVDYIEDRDLWRFRLDKSREVHAACSTYPLTLEARDQLMKASISHLAQEGEAILRYHNILVEEASKNALRETIDGHDVPSMSCPVLAINSDIGNKLSQGEKFAAVWIDRPDGSRGYSLRSSPDGLDVSKIASKFGGGGHKHAAGFIRKVRG